ncbi:Uncharacterised protein [Cedecea neteri]|uniref:Uncharacterized protein n=2 Tax=Cedecea neteri TaxID=158822 RepID=A0A291E5L6_9ENTR|nr:hypothetical protein [Cedecea neteri]ATF95374.1 hypothetical protein CO704_25095 [Cedecea neteri]SQC91974.1 Uncharacterised protein [Cedecea neteri]
MTDLKITTTLTSIPGVGMPPATAFEKLVMSAAGDKLWAGETNVPKGQITHLCPFTFAGDKWTGGAAIALPYPAGVTPAHNVPAPKITGLSVDETGKIWVCDSAHGVVYRVSGTTPEIIYTRPDDGKNQQFWAMTPVMANGKEYICVLDTTAQILLFKNDATAGAPAAATIPLGETGKTYKAYYFTYHAATQVLWSLLEDAAAPGHYALSALKMPAGALPVAGDLKVFTTLPEVNGNTASLKASPVYNDLFLGQADGKVVCLNIAKGNTQAPTVTWQSTAPQHDGVTAQLDYLEVDKAGYLWAADFYNMTTQGCIYGLDNISGAPVELPLPKGAAANEISPAMMVWQPAKDALLVADANGNSQIVRIDVKNVGPVGPDGRALYDLKFDPAALTAAPGAFFAAFKLIATNKAGSTAVKVPVAFQVQDTTIMTLSDDSPALVPTGATGLSITQLKAIGTESQASTLTATGRGGAKSTFTGRIAAAVTSVKIVPSDVRYTMQGTEFALAGKMPAITVVPTSSRTPVHVTLSGPASPVTGASPAKFEKGNPTQADVVPDNTIPVIIAGTTAGPVTITATAGSQTDTVTWHVLPTPGAAQGGPNGSYPVRNFATQASATRLVLQGEEVKGQTGHPVPVPHWYVRVSLDVSMADGITNLKFSPGAATDEDPNGKWIILQTSATGEIIVPFNKISGIAAGKFNLIIEASNTFSDKTGPWTLFTKTLPIQITRTFAE